MNREELSALRDALGVMLAWPDSVREQMARWLTPEAAKPNGGAPHPPVVAPSSSRAEARLGRPFNTQVADRRLIAAMQESPGLSVSALAKVASTSRSTTGERLRKLAARGVIEKDPDGRWRLKGDEARPTPPPSS